jgi:RNA polymerase sigma-70 factor (ECF subfamily)
MTAEEFTTLFHTCIPHLRAYARSLVRNADGAEDLVQDALLRAWASREQFVEGTNFRAWMFTILRNRFLDQRRRDRISSCSIDDVVDASLVSRPAQDAVLYFDDMARAFWTLSTPHRQILMLVGAMGLGYDEAAQIIGCAVGTVRSRLSRARTELQGTLDGRAQPSRRAAAANARGAQEFLRVLAAA